MGYQIYGDATIVMTYCQAITTLENQSANGTEMTDSTINSWISELKQGLYVHFFSNFNKAKLQIHFGL